MPYEVAKCPSCGAPIQVDTSTEKCFCPSCGNQISTVAAVKKYLVDANVDGISTIKNTMIRGEQCLDAQDWKKAAHYFDSVIDNQADNFEAWYGLLKSYTHNFTLRIEKGFTAISVQGEKGLISVLQNCKRYAPLDILEKPGPVSDGVRKGDEYLDKINKYNKSEEKGCLFVMIISLVLLLAMVLIIANFFYNIF